MSCILFHLKTEGDFFISELRNRATRNKKEELEIEKFVKSWFPDKHSNAAFPPLRLTLTTVG
jgi:hypothetical protein